MKITTEADLVPSDKMSLHNYKMPWHRGPIKKSIRERC